MPAADVQVRSLAGGGGLAVAITTARGAEAERVAAAVADTSAAELSALLDPPVAGRSQPVVSNATAVRPTEVLSDCPAGAAAPPARTHHPSNVAPRAWK